MVIGLIWEKVRPEISQSERAYYLSHTILCISIQQLMVDYKSRVLAIRDSPWLKKAPFLKTLGHYFYTIFSFTNCKPELRSV